MARLNLSTKRLQINQANVAIVVTTSIAAFVTIFSLVATRSLLAQYSYQSKVITKKEVARKQLQVNINAANNLLNSYQEFAGSTENIIGGTVSGPGERDGDNAKLILDALPSKYDFPAVATSLEKLINDKNAKIVQINGTDDELNQSGAEASGTPQPIDIPFEVDIEGSYTAMQDIIGVFERSIRPINVMSLGLSGKDGTLTLNLKGKTYYQPEKTLNIKQQVVK